MQKQMRVRNADDVSCVANAVCLPASSQLTTAATVSLQRKTSSLCSWFGCQRAASKKASPHLARYSFARWCASSANCTISSCLISQRRSLPRSVIPAARHKRIAFARSNSASLSSRSAITSSRAIRSKSSSVGPAHARLWHRGSVIAGGLLFTVGSNAGILRKRAINGDISCVAWHM